MTVGRAGVVAVLGVVAGGLVLTQPWAAASLALLTAMVAAGVVARQVQPRGDDIAGFAWAGAAFTAPLNGVRLASSVALSDAFLAIAVVAMLPSVALRRRWTTAGRGDGVLAGLGIIVTGGLIGTVFAGNAGASLVEVAKFMFAAGGSIVAMRLWAPDMAKIRSFCALWLAGAVASALWALTFSERIVGRPLGLTTHPNHLGLACLLAAAMALGFALTGQRLARRFGILSFPLLIAVLVASGSRAALLGFFVMVPTVAILSRRVQLAVRGAAIAAVFGVGVLTGVVNVPADTGLGRLLGNGTTESDALRVDHLSSSIDRFERHPLTGEGFEFAQEAHNIYLQVLVVAGPLGLIGLTLTVGSVLAVARETIKRCEETVGGARVSGDSALLAGLAGGFVGYLVAGLFQNILWDRYLWLYVAAIPALAASLRVASAAAFTDAGGTGNRSPQSGPSPVASRGGELDATRVPRGSGWPH